MMLANVFLLLTRSLASAHRIAEILDENIVLTSPENGVKKVKDGSIDFENVSFKYREDAREYALEFRQVRRLVLLERQDRQRRHLFS